MSLGRNATYNIIGSLIPVLTALVTVPLYIRMIGPARYGVLAIAWLLLGYFGLFDLGLGRATSFRVAALRDALPRARSDTFWSALAANLFMGCVGGVVMQLGAGYFFGHVFKVDEALRPEIMAAVPLLAVSVPVATVTGVLTGALQGREKFFETNVISVTSTALFQFLPLAVAWRWGPDLVLLISAALAAKAVAMLILAFSCRRVLTAGHPVRVVRSELPRLLKYGGWVTVGSIFAPLLVIVDRFAIGAAIGAVAVAIYTVPYQMAKQIQVLPAALTNAVFPRISASAQAEQRRLSDDATSALAALISLPALAGIFVLDPLLHLWVGRGIATQATPVGRILIAGFWINAFAMVPYTSLQARGRPDQVTIVQLMEIPPYFLLLYVFLQRWGVQGAAMAFAVRCLFDYLLLTWVAERRFPAWRALACNLVLLVAGVWLADMWGYKRWQWWVAAATLAAPSLALAWGTLPAPARLRIRAMLRPAIGRAA